MWKWIRYWDIRKRIWGLISFTVVLVATIGLLDAIKIRNGLLDKKQEETQLLVESAHSILAHYQQKVSDGAMDLAAAQSDAMRTIGSMRYNEVEYFWINDTRPFMIMHPIKPALDGTDVSQIKDPEGKLLFMEMVEVVMNNGSGFVEYMWPKPGFEDPVPKLSFVKHDPQWGWIVGSGVYMDDINAIFYEELAISIFRLVGFLAVFIFLAIVLANSITRPLGRMVIAMNNIASEDADLTQRLEVKGENEVAQVASGFNLFIERIQQVIGQVSNASKEMDHSSSIMAKIADKSSESMSLQLQEVEQVATAMNQMTVTTQEVASNAQAAANSAGEADNSAKDGAKIITRTVEAIKSLAIGVKDASDAVDSVHKESEKIGSILEVIRGIADQTNLLALNAAIEAARAGEQGRGFAVVADEVRTLAQRTQESTEEIQTMIESLQLGTQKAVRLIDQESKRANEEVEIAATAEAALNAITIAISNINEMNMQIATASEEQTSVANDMNLNLTRINDQSNQTTNDIADVSKSSQSVSKLAYDLSELVNQFKI